MERKIKNMDPINPPLNSSPENTAQPTATSNGVSNKYPEHSVVNKANSGTNETIRITIIIPTGAYFMSGLRDFTMNVAKNMTGFSEQWAYRFQSVVDELVNNAIEFGSAPGKEVKITFVSHYKKSIEIFVEDTGTGPEKKTAQQMSAYIEEHRHVDPATITSIRGRGLAQIVANWTDVLEFKDNQQGGLTVHVIKYLKEEES